ncbi:hypothetical protein ABPG77_005413 [Micractinium sp. CCAP 211/92]
MATSHRTIAASGTRPCLMSAHTHQSRVAGDLRRNRAGSAAYRLLVTSSARPRPSTRQPCRASASVGIAESEVQVDGRRSRESSSGPQRNGPPAAVVTFRAQRKLKYGQVLKLVGGAPQMGGWDCASAPAMKWGAGDRWMLTLEIPQGHHEYKVAVVKGHDPGFVLSWDEGPNRTLEVSEAEATARTAFLIDCDSDTEGASYSSTVHDRYERAEQGRYDSATGDRYSSVQAFGRGNGNGRGVGAGIGGAAAAAASGLMGPADASLARPHAVPHAVEDQQIRHEEKQLDELVALLEQERAARAAAEEEIKALRRQVSTGITEASALVANSAALREEFAVMAAQMEETQAAREALQAERDALAARLQQAEAAREALAEEREGLDGRLSWTAQQLAALQAERDRMAEEHAAALARAAQLQAEREGGPQELSSALARCDELAAERDSLARQLAEARRQLGEAREEAEHAQREVDRAAQQRAVLRSVGLLLSSYE